MQHLHYLFSYSLLFLSFFFFFNDTATTEIYTLSLHDALPICEVSALLELQDRLALQLADALPAQVEFPAELFERRSEEHTSELQSQSNLVCRLLLEKKKKKKKSNSINKIKNYKVIYAILHVLV